LIKFKINNFSVARNVFVGEKFPIIVGVMFKVNIMSVHNYLICLRLDLLSCKISRGVLCIQVYIILIDVVLGTHHCHFFTVCIYVISNLNEYKIILVY